MEMSSDDNSIKTFLSKYPLHEQSTVATKLTRIGIRYIIKTSSSFHPPSLKELDDIIYQLGLSKPAKDEQWMQPIVTKQRSSPRAMQQQETNPINQCPTFGKKKEEEKKRAHTLDNRQTKGINSIKKKDNQNQQCKYPSKETQQQHIKPAANSYVTKERRINEHAEKQTKPHPQPQHHQQTKLQQQHQQPVKNHYQMKQESKPMKPSQPVQTQISTQCQTQPKEPMGNINKTQKGKPPIQIQTEPNQSYNRNHLVQNDNDNQPIELTQSQNMSIEVTNKVETPQSIKNMNNTNPIHKQVNVLNTQQNTSNYHFKETPREQDNTKLSERQQQQQPKKSITPQAKEPITIDDNNQVQSNPIDTEPSYNPQLSYNNYPIATEPNLSSSNCYSFRESILPHHCHCSRHSYYCYNSCYCYNNSTSHHHHYPTNLPSYLQPDSPFNPSKTQFSLRKQKDYNIERPLSTSQYVSKSGITYELSPRNSSYY